MYAYGNIELKNKPAIFRSALAFSYANRCTKPMRVVQGECGEKGGEFLVVTPADAARLEKAGYEIVA